MRNSSADTEIMEWTRETTLILIDEYRNRPGLWDLTHEDYRKKGAKRELLYEISNKFNRSVPIIEIEKKFHTLRTQYHREINRMQQSRGSEPYKSKWFAFKHLQFLSSPNACRNGKLSITPSPKTVIPQKAKLRSEVIIKKNESLIIDHSKSDDNAGETKEFIYAEIKVPIQSNNMTSAKREISIEPIEIEDLADSSDPEQSNYETSSGHNVLKEEIYTPRIIKSTSQNHSATKKDNNMMYGEIIYEEEHQQQSTSNNNTNTIKLKSPEYSQCRDENTVFGEYVANELRYITNREVLVVVKHKINTALYEATLAQLGKGE